MSESRIRDDNYYLISGWMINRLGLKGVQLSVFAIIYGFSQDGENEYTGSLQYLCDFTGGTSKPTIIKALQELTEKGFIIRREETINNVMFVRYKANLQVVKNFNGGSKEILPGVVKKFNGGSKEILPNNEIDKESNKEYINISAEFESLWKQYPRKIGKPKALKAYEKARKNGTTYEEVQAGITRYKQQIAAQRTAVEYIKHGVTWFNNECWNDEYTTAYGTSGAAIDPTKDDLDDII